MKYDKYLARAHRALTRFYFGLRKAPDKKPAEPILVIKPAAFVRAFISANPRARRYRRLLLARCRGSWLVFTERQWRDRIAIGRTCYPA